MGLLVHNLKAMKKLILLLSICVLLNVYAKAQEYNDLIVKKNNDTIKCKITLVNNINIFYLHKPKKIELNKYFPLRQAKLYIRDGKIIKQPFDIQSRVPVGEIEKKLAERTDLIYVQDKNDLNIDSVKYVYCQIVGVSKFLSRKVTIAIDYGEETKFFQDTRLIDKATGKAKIFYSMIDALNYMGKRGWGFVQAYAVTVGNQNVYHFLLKKEIKIDF